jgi:predicted phosphoribosyltransferase
LALIWTGRDVKAVMSRSSHDLFRDRADAGRRLAERLLAAGYGQRSDTLVLALPRGGEPVGF